MVLPFEYFLLGIVFTFLPLIPLPSIVRELQPFSSSNRSKHLDRQRLEHLCPLVVVEAEEDGTYALAFCVSNGSQGSACKGTGDGAWNVENDEAKAES